MECLVCLEENATLMTLSFTNNDVIEMYLCEECIDRFTFDSAVTDISLADMP